MFTFKKNKHDKWTGKYGKKKSAEMDSFHEFLFAIHYTLQIFHNQNNSSSQKRLHKRALHTHSSSFNPVWNSQKIKKKHRS